MKHFATLLVGTSVAVLLAICDVAGTPAGRGVSANDADAGAIAGARALPDGHPSITGFFSLPEGHPPVLPEGHPPLPNLGSRCPRSSVNPWMQPGDAIRMPRESPDIVATWTLLEVHAGIPIAVQHDMVTVCGQTPVQLA